MSFVERSIILCPYLGGSTIGGSTVHVYCLHVHCIIMLTVNIHGINYFVVRNNYYFIIFRLCTAGWSGYVE